MRIPSFAITNARSIQLASCDAVPQLMVIAGPNGAGKSTLLNVLRSVAGREHVLYVGPHRAIRRQSVQQRHLISTPFHFDEILALEGLPGYEGIRVLGGERNPWDADDSSSYLKHSLCQVEVDRQQAISARYDNEGEIKRDSLPDPWTPLRDLTTNLLPHLSFQKVDNSNRDNIRALWKVHSKDTIVDLDDLSSGEKSIIQMFYPLVERKIRQLLSEVRGEKKAEDAPESCVLIDEPELHLHPNLQVKVFDYLRILTSTSNTQAVLATHSPTIVEHASFDELFLLRPIELVVSGENQLVQIASDDERLKTLQEVFGTTSNLTAMQPVVVVEGILQTEKAATISDRKLYRAMNPGFDKVTLLPGGGKSECIKLLQSLNQFLPVFSSRLKAVALLDRDIGQAAEQPDVYVLPVSMIENFMLDPLPLWESIQSVLEKTPFKTIDDLTVSLEKLMDELESSEIERRTKASLGLVYFRPDSPVANIPAQAEECAKSIVTRYSSTAVETAHNTAADLVKELRARKERRESFHGKEAMDLFFKQYLQNTALSKTVFKFEAARHARRRKGVTAFFDTFFGKLGLPGLAGSNEKSKPVAIA
jgi:energy-coupling factor transporter ATP-binding protein EcfA2